MDNKYYKGIGRINNNHHFAYYEFNICWIPQNIINDNDVNGYIVQKVIFDNTTNIIINKEKKKHLEYYEAWKVKNNKIR